MLEERKRTVVGRASECDIRVIRGLVVRSERGEMCIASYRSLLRLRGELQLPEDTRWMLAAAGRN